MDEHKDKIEELLVDFELARQEGRQLTAEELCVDHPFLVPRVAEEIRKLMATSWIVDSVVEPSDTSRFAISGAPPLTAEGLLEQMQRYGLFDQANMLSDEAGLRDGSTNDVDAMARKFMEQGVLTPYQFEVFSGRKHGPIRLDRYLILDEIGAGATGRVFQARHLSMKRIVAIKLLDPKWDSAKRRQRFEREIESVAQLAHPNIVTAFDACTSDAHFFLVMEYIDGPDLMECVQETGPLEESQALALVVEVAKAMQFAHERGVIHRDIKPSNLVRFAQAADDVRVLDLGIARIESETLEGEDTLTSEDVPIGTVAFMAPEQAENSQNADARSDIYSLGCTLFFLLTGRPPFSGRNPIEMLVQHRETDIRSKLSETSISLPVQSLLIWMLDKQPDNRPASMAMVAESIQKILAGKKPSVGKKSPVELSRLYRVLVGVAVATLLAMAVWTYQVWNKSKTPAVVQSPFDAETYQQDFAKWVTDNGGYVEAITDFGVQEFVDAGSIPAGKFKITSVDLYDLTSDFSFSWLAKLPDLRSVQVNASVVNQVDAYYLPKLTQIKNLGFGDCEFEPTVVSAIAELSQLNTLLFNDVDLDRSDLEELGQLSNLTRFVLSQSLDEDGPSIPDDLFEQLLEMPRLNELDLSGHSLTSQQWRSLCRHPRMRSIQVARAGLKDSDFAQLPACVNLKYLNLDFAKLGPSALGWLMQHTDLETLYLEGTGLSDAQVQELIRFQNLQTLDVSGLRVTPGTLKKLAFHPPITSLRISGVDQSEVALDWIPAKQMELLDLSRTNVTLEQLEKVSGLNVGTLDLSGNGLNQDGLQNFLDQNPLIENLILDLEEAEFLVIPNQ